MEALNLRSTQVPIRRPALSPLHSLSSPHQLQQRSVSATPYNTPPRDKVKWLVFGRKGVGLKRASETGRNSCQPTELYDVRDYREEATKEDEQVVVPLAHNLPTQLQLLCHAFEVPACPEMVLYLLMEGRTVKLSEQTWSPLFHQYFSPNSPLSIMDSAFYPLPIAATIEVRRVSSLAFSLSLPSFLSRHLTEEISAPRSPEQRGETARRDSVGIRPLHLSSRSNEEGAPGTPRQWSAPADSPLRTESLNASTSTATQTSPSTTPSRPSSTHFFRSASSSASYTALSSSSASQQAPPDSSLTSTTFTTETHKAIPSAQSPQAKNITSPKPASSITSTPASSPTQSLPLISSPASNNENVSYSYAISSCGAPSPRSNITDSLQPSPHIRTPDLGERAQLSPMNPDTHVAPQSPAAKTPEASSDRDFPLRSVVPSSLALLQTDQQGEHDLAATGWMASPSEVEPQTSQTEYNATEARDAAALISEVSKGPIPLVRGRQITMHEGSLFSPTLLSATSFHSTSSPVDPEPTTSSTGSFTREEILIASPYVASLVPPAAVLEVLPCSVSPSAASAISQLQPDANEGEVRRARSVTEMAQVLDVSTMHGERESQSEEEMDRRKTFGSNWNESFSPSPDLNDPNRIFHHAAPLRVMDIASVPTTPPPSSPSSPTSRLSLPACTSLFVSANTPPQPQRPVPLSPPQTISPDKARALLPAVEASADQVGRKAARSTTIEENEENDEVMKAVELDSFQEQQKEGLADERDADFPREDLDLPTLSDLPSTEPIRTIESTSFSPDFFAPPAETAFSDETTSAFDSPPPALPRRVTFEESIESDSSSGSESDSDDSELDEDTELGDVRRMMLEEEGSVFEDEERTGMDQFSVQRVEVETESLDSIERDSLVELDNALGLFVEPTPASSFHRNSLIDGPSPAYLRLPPSPAELELPPAHEQALSQEVDAESGDYFDELDSYLDEAEIGVAISVPLPPSPMDVLTRPRSRSKTISRPSPLLPLSAQKPTYLSPSHLFVELPDEREVKVDSASVPSEDEPRPMDKLVRTETASLLSPINLQLDPAVRWPFDGGIYPSVLEPPSIATTAPPASSAPPARPPVDLKALFAATVHEPTPAKKRAPRQPSARRLQLLEERDLIYPYSIACSIPLPPSPTSPTIPLTSFSPSTPAKTLFRPSRLSASFSFGNRLPPGLPGPATLSRVLSSPTSTYSNARLAAVSGSSRDSYSSAESVLDDDTAAVAVASSFEERRRSERSERIVSVMEELRKRGGDDRSRSVWEPAKGFVKD